MDASATASGCADALTAGQAGIVATNLTYLAFVDLLKKTETPRSTVAIVGSGARACAAIAACQSLGFQVICVTSRSWISTEALHESESAQRLRRLGALPTLWPNVTDPVQSSNFSREMRMQFREIAASANVFIQTVAVDSLSTDARQISQTIPWSQTRRDALVCDLVYGPSPGPFLASAEKEALARVGGIEMLTKYSARLVEFFTGQQLSRSLLHAAALRVCTRPFP
ncbi:MAG: hypothetical protein CSA75_02285 [Sorangium cellulosum]|nr:MAG: hypothetical protein CSA75_02285 [Sorangium cellulosum]